MAIRTDNRWQLVSGDRILGTLTFRDPDQPFLICDFSPTPEFAAIEPLFVTELEILNTSPFDAELWEQEYQKIDALELRLVPVGDSQAIDGQLLLHIEGKTTRFRF
jgi:hypothetical protein